MNSLSGIYRVQNWCLYVAVKHRYAVAYQKVWSGLRRGVEPYAVAYPKARYKKICFLRSGVENYAAMYQKVWSQFISF